LTEKSKIVNLCPICNNYNWYKVNEQKFICMTCKSEVQLGIKKSGCGDVPVGA